MDRINRWCSRGTIHRPLVLDLLLIILCCLVAGLYFNEQWADRSQQLRQQAITSLANQLADASYVPLADNNRISLNVLAQQLDKQLPVAGVRIKRLDGSIVSSAGSKSGLQAQAAVGRDGQEIIGRVVVYGSVPTSLAWWPFLLVMLCLLGLRTAFSLFWEQLLPQSLRQWHDLRQRLQAHAQGSNPRDTPEAVVVPLVEARLAVRIVNYTRLCERYTCAARDHLVDAYDVLFAQVAAEHGLEAARLNGNNLLTVKRASKAEALFALAQFAEQLRLCCERLDKERRTAGDPCLAFSLLLHSADAPLAQVGMLPFALLLKAPSEWLEERLHYRLVEHWQEGGSSWQLLAVDGLAAEFGQRLEAAATRLLDEISQTDLETQ